MKAAVRPLVVLMMIVCNSSFGVDVVLSEGIHVTADTTTANLRTGVITYEGNVVVTREHLEFRSDKIVEHREGAEITVVIATGSPAVYIDKLAQPGTVSSGTAKRVEYIASENRVLLTDFVLEDRAGNRTSGPQGVYILDDGKTD